MTHTSSPDNHHTTTTTARNSSSSSSSSSSSGDTNNNNNNNSKRPATATATAATTTTTTTTTTHHNRQTGRLRPHTRNNDHCHTPLQHPSAAAATTTPHHAATTAAPATTPTTTTDATPSMPTTQQQQQQKTPEQPPNTALKAPSTVNTTSNHKPTTTCSTAPRYIAPSFLILALVFCSYAVITVCLWDWGPCTTTPAPAASAAAAAIATTGHCALQNLPWDTIPDIRPHLTIIFALSVAMLLWSYVQAVRTDPGTVPRNHTQQQQQRLATSLYSKQQRYPQQLVANATAAALMHQGTTKAAAAAAAPSPAPAQQKGKTQHEQLPPPPATATATTTTTTTTTTNATIPTAIVEESRIRKSLHHTRQQDSVTSAAALLRQHPPMATATTYTQQPQQQPPIARQLSPDWDIQQQCLPSSANALAMALTTVVSEHLAVPPLFDGSQIGAQLCSDATGTRKPSPSEYCHKCEAFKPMRAHHCARCRICVLRMDHHCPWLNNCVGIGNHKQYLNFLFYGTLSSALALLLVIARNFFCPRKLSMRSLLLIWNTAITVLPTLLGLTFLLRYHWRLLKRNATTIEDQALERDRQSALLEEGRPGGGKPRRRISVCKKAGTAMMRKRRRNKKKSAPPSPFQDTARRLARSSSSRHMYTPTKQRDKDVLAADPVSIYDMGVRANLEQVLGHDWWLWFFPTAAHGVGDGLWYPINPKHLRLVSSSTSAATSTASGGED